jgi:hypothetical protein
MGTHHIAQTNQHPVDMIEPLPERDDLVSQLAEVLTPVFQFISRGRIGGTMAHRSWVVLYLTRSDLIDGETLDAAAKRMGVTPQRMHNLVLEFRESVPNFHDGKRKRSPARAAKKPASPTPPVRNLFPGKPSSAGSALR